MSMKSRLVPKFALAAFSCALALVSVEFVYRLYLARQLTRVDLGTRTIFAFSAPIHRFHRTVGYEYVPSTEFTSLVYQRGKPIWTSKHCINSRGNFSKEQQLAPDYKIFIFGDSFTVCQHHGASWPDHLEEAIFAKEGLQSEVRNYARDGFGIIQMVKLAAEVVSEAPPRRPRLRFHLGRSHPGHVVEKHPED